MFANLFRFWSSRPSASQKRVRTTLRTILRIESLEGRDAPAADLRIATYNVGAGVRSGMDTVLRAIGDQVVNGDARPVDVLALQEVHLNLSEASSIASLLNGIYGAGSYSYSTTAGQGDSTQGLVYRTSTIELVSSQAFGTVSTSGMARQPIRYQLRPVGFGTTNDVYLYNAHPKASSGSSNEARREVEAEAIRADADALGDGVNVLYVGDFNLYSNNEASYTTYLSAGNGQATDPLGSGSWAGAANASKHTQSPATTAAYGGQVTGGMDDRFDFQLVSGELNDDAGLDILASSYRVLGNNGSAYDLAINNAANTWSWDAVSGSTVTRSDLLNAIASISDHVPVIADYEIIGNPTIGSFAVAPTSVVSGSTVTLTATSVVGGTISGVTFYRESNGTPGLQIGSDTSVGAGTQSGADWTNSSVSTAGLAPTDYTFYAVATNTWSRSSDPSSATLTVTAQSTTGTVAGWDVSGQTNYGTQGLGAGTLMDGVTNSQGLTRGSGVGVSGSAAANAWGGNNWAATAAAGVSGNQFITFAITVGADSILSLSALDLYYRRSGTGATSAFWEFQIDGGSWTTIGTYNNVFSSTATTGAQMTTLDLSGVSGLQDLTAGTVVTFRLTPFGATSSAGTFYISNKSGVDLSLTGTVESW